MRLFLLPPWCYSLDEMIATMESKTDISEFGKVLNARERALVEYYLQGMSLKEAGIKAGYSAHSASWTAGKVLKKPRVKAYLDALGTEVMRKTSRTPEGIRDKIAEIADKAQKEDTRLRALELLGKATPGTFEPARAPVEFNLFAILGNLVNAPTPSPATIDLSPSPEPGAPDNVSTASEPGQIALPADPDSPPATPLYVDIQPDKIVDQISSSTTPVAEQDTKQ